METESRNKDIWYQEAKAEASLLIDLYAQFVRSSYAETHGNHRKRKSAKRKSEYLKRRLGIAERVYLFS